MAPTKKDVKKTPTNTLPPGIKLNPDGSWIILATYQNPQKQRRFAERTLPSTMTLAQVVEEREKLIQNLKTPPININAPLPKIEEIPTLTDYSKSWLQTRSKRIRPLTAQNYARELTNHILPRLGHKPLNKIKRMDIEAFKTYLENDSGLKVRTARTIWAIALMVLKDGWADYEISDKSARIRWPEGELEPAGKALSLEEIQRIIDVGQTILMEHEYLHILLLIFTGLRRTELRLLLSKDVFVNDPQNAYLLASHSKTKKGKNRQMFIPDHVALLVQDYLDKNVDCTYLFPAKFDKTKPCDLSLATRACQKIADHLQIHFTPHDLRRTAITQAVLGGAHRSVVRSVFGHSDDKMTELYVRPSQDDRKALLKVIEGGLTKKEVG